MYDAITDGRRYVADHRRRAAVRILATTSAESTRLSRQMALHEAGFDGDSRQVCFVGPVRTAHTIAAAEHGDEPLSRRTASSGVLRAAPPRFFKNDLVTDSTVAA